MDFGAIQPGDAVLMVVGLAGAAAVGIGLLGLRRAAKATVADQSENREAGTWFGQPGFRLRHWAVVVAGAAVVVQVILAVGSHLAGLALFDRLRLEDVVEVRIFQEKGDKSPWEYIEPAMAVLTDPAKIRGLYAVMDGARPYSPSHAHGVNGYLVEFVTVDKGYYVWVYAADSRGAQVSIVEPMVGRASDGTIDGNSLGYFRAKDAAATVREAVR